MACLKLLAIRILAATGKVIRADTSNTPTIRMDAEIANAVNIINSK